MLGAKSKWMLAQGNSSVNGYDGMTVSFNHIMYHVHILMWPLIPQSLHKVASRKASMSASMTARERGTPSPSKLFGAAVQLRQSVRVGQHN